MTDAEKVLQAEKEIRVEGAKAAFLHAVVEATLAALAGVFFLSSSEIGPESVGPLSGPVAVSIFVALLFGVSSFYLTYRRRTLETFEELNPNVREALRTARDSARDGEETEMAQHLYEDVAEQLKSTSAEGFVSLKRVMASVGLIVAVGLFLLHASFFGVGGPGDGLFGLDENAGGDSAPDDGQQAGEGGATQYDELRDPEEVMGEEGEVLQGTEEEQVQLRTGGEGEGGEIGERGTTGEIEDRVGESNVDAQRAEFAPEEEIEDAELVKEYNLRVRDEE